MTGMVCKLENEEVVKELAEQKNKIVKQKEAVEN